MPTVDLSGPVLHLERVLDHPVDRVFGAFVASEVLEQWWGPRGFTVPRAELDVRVGGGAGHAPADGSGGAAGNAPLGGASGAGPAGSSGGGGSAGMNGGLTRLRAFLDQQPGSRS